LYKRQFRFAQFITETLGPIVSKRGIIDSAPIVGIDEGLNNEEYIGSMCRSLLISGTISCSQPLWYKRRQDETGRRISILGGSLSPFAQEATGGYGREIRHYSWPDEGVVAAAVASFTHIDRYCILTTNKKNDANGLRQIIMNEVKPALETLQPQRLGLLVLVMSPSATLGTYSLAVASRLACRKIEPGVTWEQLG